MFGSHNPAKRGREVSSRSSESSKYFIKEASLRAPATWRRRGKNSEQTFVYEKNTQKSQD
jgi:hypothetical protein